MKKGSLGQKAGYVFTWFKHIMIRTNSSLGSKDHTRVAGCRKVLDQAMG